MKDGKSLIRPGGSESEIKRYADYLMYMKEIRDNIFENEQIHNGHMYLTRQVLSKILVLSELYKKILDMHGIIMEFGVRWGGNMLVFNMLRGIYEPYNYLRKIVGFDTFSGYIRVDKEDGSDECINVGGYGVTDSYDLFLRKLLNFHEQNSPISHIKKCELIKGDASVELEKYLRERPETIVSLVYFDLDLYYSTKTCLQLLKPYLAKGCIIAFDELCHPTFPGETTAFKEALGLNNFSIKRFNFEPCPSYIVYE